MLGLKYGTVALAHYDPDWAKAFGAEAARLRQVPLLAACAVEHVGSTAVPGLSAKPILDIAIGCPERLRVADVIMALESIGYQYRGDAGTAGGHVLVRETTPGVRTHHVHIVELDGDQWRTYLRLRDWLRVNAEARATYDRVKQELAANHQDDRRAYTTGKAQLIAALLHSAAADSSLRLRPNER
jgi:GrpB-like predicted nucleotidyltransferase (UPF0157 family)